MKLRKGDEIILLPSGEETRVIAAAKNVFLVKGHLLAMRYEDEYDPKENPSGSWAKKENRSQWNTGP